MFSKSFLPFFCLFSNQKVSFLSLSWVNQRLKWHSRESSPISRFCFVLPTRWADGSLRDNRLNKNPKWTISRLLPDKVSPICITCQKSSLGDNWQRMNQPKKLHLKCPFYCPPAKIDSHSLDGVQHLAITWFAIISHLEKHHFSFLFLWIFLLLSLFTLSCPIFPARLEFSPSGQKPLSLNIKLYFIL